MYNSSIFEQFDFSAKEEVISANCGTGSDFKKWYTGDFYFFHLYET